MKKTLLTFCFLVLSLTIFAQQFSQYNTGTLYDSFENPAQRSFIPDSSKQFASNFFIPNFNANFFLSGDAQQTLKSRAFLNAYNNSALKIGQNKNNLANADANAYVFMLKMFTSLNGDVEMGISAQIRGDAHGSFSDETAAAFNGTASFVDAKIYNNIFNDNYQYEAYDQISYSYREKITKQFSFGIKLSALSGVQYQKLDISSSNIVYDKSNDAANVTLGGVYFDGFTPGHASTRDFLPTFRNPGASISLGTMYRTQDGFTIQANVKDLGFIHWSSRSHISDFNESKNIQGLSTPAREDSIYNVVRDIARSNELFKSFTTPVDGKAEVSVMKNFWLDDDKLIKYSPTLIASKQLFYTGFVGALVNPFQYKNYVVTFTTTYDDLKTFNLGGQFMIKSSNAEFFIGSDKLLPSAHFIYDGINKNAGNITAANTGFRGADIFLGVSFKFGPVIEHPMNASTIPTGEKGFLGRLWGRIFKTND